MPLPPLTTNSRPYRAPLLTLPASAALKRPRAASAPCENEEARQRKRSKSNTDIGFMNDTIHEDTVDETPVDVSAAIHKSKGKEKESLSPATSQVFEGITAAVIEELAQVSSPLQGFPVYSPFSFQGAEMWMLHRTML